MSTYTNSITSESTNHFLNLKQFTLQKKLLIPHVVAEIIIIGCIKPIIIQNTDHQDITSSYTFFRALNSNIITGIVETKLKLCIV